MDKYELRLAPHKTKSVSMKCRRKIPSFTLQGHDIENKKAPRYLGVTMDYGLTFARHGRKVTEKTKKKH